MAVIERRPMTVRRKPKSVVFNRRQMAMHTKLLTLGFVPVVWQRKDGAVWIEEEYNEAPHFTVGTSYGDGVRASVRTVERAIKEAVESNAEVKALMDVAASKRLSVVASDEYNPRLKGEAAKAARSDPNKPEGACCNNERRGMNGGCFNCGDPCL